MPSTTTESTRQQDVDRYIVLDAIEELLRTIGAAGLDPTLHLEDCGLTDLLGLTGEEHRASVLACELDEPRLEGTVELFGTLWPDEEGESSPEGREYKRAAASGRLLTGRILAALAEAEHRSGFLSREAQRLMEGASDDA